MKNLIQTVKRMMLLAAIVFGMPGAALSAETLTDAFVDAYKNSNILDQNRALLRAADEDLAQEAAALLPVIDFIATATQTAPTRFSNTENLVTTAGIAAELLLFDNGGTRHAKEAARENVLSLRSALVDLEQDLLFDTVEVYMEVIRARQAVSLAESNVELIAQELQAATDRFEVGEVTRTDVSIAEARLAAARSGLAAASGNFDVAREEFRTVVGRYPGNLRWPERSPETADTEEAAKALAVRNHPSIDRAQHTANAAEANVERAMAAFGPQFTANSSVTLEPDQPKRLSAGLTMRTPIYRGNTLRSITSQSLARQEAAQAAVLQSVLQVEQEVGIAWASVTVADAQTEAAERQVTASRMAFEGFREEAKLGARTTLDVLDAEQDLLDARNDLLSAEVLQYISVYRLLASMGFLTVDHLNLGIATYDPEEYYQLATERGFKSDMKNYGGELKNEWGEIKGGIKSIDLGGARRSQTSEQ